MRKLEDQVMTQLRQFPTGRTEAALAGSLRDDCRNLHSTLLQLEQDRKIVSIELDGNVLWTLPSRLEPPSGAVVSTDPLEDIPVLGHVKQTTEESTRQLSEVVKKHTTKPPLGIMPLSVFEQKMITARVQEIVDAMERYAAASMPVPSEWVVELRTRLAASTSSLAA